MASISIRVIHGSTFRWLGWGIASNGPAAYTYAMIATSYRYIVRLAGVRSGNAIIEGTRIGVHDVVAMIRTGCSVDEVVTSLPRLTRAQVYESLAYYEDHQDELEPLIAAQIAELDA